MGNAKPRMPGEGIIDLSNDAAWQARLEEARARRAEALRKAGKTDDTRKRRAKPWEESDPATSEPVARTGGVDFHDRINRFKKIAGVEPTREKSAEELDRIDALLWGSGEGPSRRTAEIADTPPEPDRLAAPTKTHERDEDAPVNIFIELDEPPRLPDHAPITSTPTSMMVAASRDAAARSLIAEAGDDPTLGEVRPSRGASIPRVLFLATCIAVSAGSFYVTATGTFVPALFWDSSPPSLQTGIGDMPEVAPGAASSGFAAPGAFTEPAESGTGWPPALATPAGYNAPATPRPLPRPWRTT